MVTDLHCHYFPAAALRGVVPSIEVTANAEGYRFASAVLAMQLDAGLLDLDMQRADMARQGVSRRAICTPPFTFQYELPVAEGVAWSRAINDGLASAIAEHPDAFVGFATVPLQDVSAAVVELERALDALGFRGVEIASNLNGVELDDASLEPFWELAAARRIPILIHPHYIAGPDRMGSYYFRNLIGNPVETALAGARLLFGGVLERHPNLRVILSHGGGALTHLIGRLEHGYAVRPEARLRASDPSAHLRRLYYDTIVFDPGVLRHIVETVGASQVVLGTDYPFDMGEPDPVAFVRGSGLSDADVATILANGARLLGDG